MADRGTATFIPTAAFNVASNYDPIIRGSGGESVDPKRYLNVSGTATPIQ